MIGKLGMLLLILILFFLIVYFINRREGMSTLDIVDEADSDVSIYYGKFGTVRVRTLSDGSKVVVSVKQNENYSDNKEMITVYGEDGETLRIFINEDGKFSVVDNSTVDEDARNTSTTTFYGNHGSVTVATNDDGTRTIIDYTVNEEDTVGIHTFYGPKGNSVDVIRTPDGNLKIMAGDGDGNRVFVKTGSDYIRKSEIVPPVCPACPSITSCASADGKCDGKTETEEREEISNTFSTVEGPNGTKVTQGNNGATLIQGKNDTSVVVGPKGNTVVASPQSEQAASTDVSVPKQSNVVMQQKDIKIIRTPEGNVRTDDKVGMYLGDNRVMNEPMPILNNFSTFGR